MTDTLATLEAQRRQRYRSLGTELDAVLPACGDEVAAMATFVAVLHGALEKASWTGFYRVVEPRLLRVGPYQGPIGCLEIDFEHGVCGAAAREQRSHLVADVHSFAGHIACDPSSRSEVVVPVFGPDGGVVAVLDIDSHELAAFDEIDVEELEVLVAKLAACLAAAASSRSAGTGRSD